MLPQLAGDANIVGDGHGQLAVTGRGREAGTILWCGDAGATWAEAGVPPPVSADPRLHRNPDGTLFARDTTGFEWHGMSTQRHRSGDGVVVATLDRGRIIRSTDRGASWSAARMQAAAARP